MDTDDYPDIRTFLDAARLGQYVRPFTEQGFDDVEFLVETIGRDQEGMALLVQQTGLKPGHLMKLRVAISRMQDLDHDSQRRESQTRVYDPSQTPHYDPYDSSQPPHFDFSAPEYRDCPSNTDFDEGGDSSGSGSGSGSGGYDGLNQYTPLPLLTETTPTLSNEESQGHSHNHSFEPDARRQTADMSYNTTDSRRQTADSRQIYSQEYDEERVEGTNAPLFQPATSREQLPDSGYGGERGQAGQAEQSVSPSHYHANGQILRGPGPHYPPFEPDAAK
jgi:hypothetical protein